MSVESLQVDMRIDVCEFVEMHLEVGSFEGVEEMDEIRQRIFRLLESPNFIFLVLSKEVVLDLLVPVVFQQNMSSFHMA